MLLTCKFLDKVRLYDRVLKHEKNRIFVPTDEELRAGADVEIQILVGDDPVAVRSRGKVAAFRTRRGAGRLGTPGVWVQLAEAEAESLRRAVDIEKDDADRTTVRLHRRMRISLRVFVEKPITRTLRTVGISPGGVCLASLLPTPMGQTLLMNIEFGSNTIPCYGKIVWRREDLGQTGVEFRFQNQAARAKLVEEVHRLAEAETTVIYAKPTILVVDDDIATLKALEHILSVRGYGTMMAASGLEALSRARDGCPALILLDVLMPGMNGLEVCRVLKRDAETSRVPVILISALAADELGLLLEESGALAALPKPCRIQTLEALVESVFDHAQSLVAPSPDASAEERRSSQRVPAFLRCYYESDSLHVQATLQDISKGGGFLTSYWGDLVGNRARLTLLDHLQHPVQIDIEVVRRLDWGVVNGKHPNQVAGMGVRFLDCPGLEELLGWLAQHEEELQTNPVVVLVDDNRDHLEIMSTTLRHAGYTVVTLDSPLGVSNAIALANPALVILDFMMPGLDGSKLCRLLKKDRRTSSVPIWLYSTLDANRLEMLAAKAGADGYLQKGTRPSKIVNRVNALLKP